MKKSISLILLVSLLLSCLMLPAAVALDAGQTPSTDQEYDDAAKAAGKHFRVGTATEAYANGDMTGYYAYTSIETVTKSGAADGKTLTLICDVDTGEKAYAIKSKITLDGNGYTLTGSRTGILLNFHSDCTVKNLTAINEGKGGVLQVGANTLTVTNSTVKNPNSSTYGAIVVQKNATLILETGAKILAEGTVGTGLRCGGVVLNQSGAKCEIRDGAEIRTTGNTFTLTTSSAAPSTAIIHGGTIETNRRLWASNGLEGYSLLIDGGKITSTSTADPMIMVTSVVGSTVQIHGGEFFGQTKLIDTENYAGLTLGGTVKWNGNVIYAAPTENSVITMVPRLRLPGGSTATRENSGILFESKIDKAWLDSLTNEAVTVTTGTLILPGFLLEDGKLTQAAIERIQNLKLLNDGWSNEETAESDGVYCFDASMVSLSEVSLTREIAGIGYVILTIPNVGTYTFWAIPQVGVVRNLANAYDTASADDMQKEILSFFRGTGD